MGKDLPRRSSWVGVPILSALGNSSIMSGKHKNNWGLEYEWVCFTTTGKANTEYISSSPTRHHSDWGGESGAHLPAYITGNV